MTLPKLVAFDIDGTLTASKRPMTPSMLEVFSRLVNATKVVLTSGGKLELATTQIVSLLPEGTNLSQLYILPTSGSAMYVYRNGAWVAEYNELLTDEEAAHIIDVLKRSAEETGIIDFSTPSYGERIENRGSQITLSALGQVNVPLDEKAAWDPDRSKRLLLKSVVDPLLPNYDVKLGGMSTLDVTKHGINKAYGIRKISEYLSLPISEMLYIGDALFPGGNDEVVKETGIATRQTSGPEETAQIIEALLLDKSV